MTTRSNPVEFLLHNALIKAGHNPTPQYILSRTPAWMSLHGPQPRYFRLDFAFPESHLGIEIDGAEYHSSEPHREADARRQREIQHQGWTVIRFTAREINRTPNICAAIVAKFLK